MIGRVSVYNIYYLLLVLLSMLLTSDWNSEIILNNNINNSLVSIICIWRHFLVDYTCRIKDEIEKLKKDHENEIER